MAITEVVAAEAVKEGAKVIAKKVAKEAVKNVAKNAVKNVAKKAVKGALKEKPKKVPLYTDEERAELSALRSKKAYYKKKLKDLKPEEVTEKITMHDVRPFLSDQTARECAYAGYFDGDDYYNRDFREWMSDLTFEDNGMTYKIDVPLQYTAQYALMQKVINEYNTLGGFDLGSSPGTIDEEYYKKMSEYSSKVKDVEEQIAKITKKAHDRRNMKIAKDLAKRNRLENAESLADAFEEGDILISKLSNPEREAVNFVKEKFSKAITDNISFNGLNEDQTRAAKYGVYKAIMDNPIEGLRTGIKETISADIKSKYGNDAGDLASTLVDVATGKGSAKSIGLELFKGVVNKTGLNPALMDERAEELISMGESTIGEEAMKRFGRDVIVDIGKAIIKSGGQIEIAIPMAIKSILFDAGKAGAKAIMK